MNVQQAIKTLRKAGVEIGSRAEAKALENQVQIDEAGLSRLRRMLAQDGRAVVVGDNESGIKVFTVGRWLNRRKCAATATRARQTQLAAKQGAK